MKRMMKFLIKILFLKNKERKKCEELADYPWKSIEERWYKAKKNKKEKESGCLEHSSSWLLFDYFITSNRNLWKSNQQNQASSINFLTNEKNFIFIYLIADCLTETIQYIKCLKVQRSINRILLAILPNPYFEAVFIFVS